MAKATLLIVDDEELVRWSLRERFTREGFTVIEAGTAAGGVEQSAGRVGHGQCARLDPAERQQHGAGVDRVER